ncbi:MAG TPA: hypothetical protein VI997_04725 [Candidatus Thermoplasmatota archaeon]|nr:hypothetical protein [Candidatus Thermoplasmatota archaeon]
MSFLSVELTRDEVLELLRLAKARHFEVERMLLNLEETEGLDATKWQARRTLVAQSELAQDLVLKLEAAARPRGS